MKIQRRVGMTFRQLLPTGKEGAVLAGLLGLFYLLHGALVRPEALPHTFGPILPSGQSTRWSSCIIGQPEKRTGLHCWDFRLHPSNRAELEMDHLFLGNAYPQCSILHFL